MDVDKDETESGINGLSEPCNDGLTRTHEAQRFTSETTSTVKKHNSGALNSFHLSSEQRAQSTNSSNGSRIPRQVLMTLLPQKSTDNLVIAELPSGLDADHINATYSMISIPVPDNLSFRDRFTSLLRYFVKLQSSPKPVVKQTIIVLSPLKTGSTKIITLAEKLKRDLKKCGVVCFQYSAVQSRTVKISRTGSVKTSPKAESKEPRENRPSTKVRATVGLKAQAGNDNDEEQAFQNMEASHDELPLISLSGDPKFHRVPVMTIFFALSSVPELRQLYTSDALTVYLF